MVSKRIIHLIPTLERGGSEMSQLRMLPLLGTEVESVFVTIGPKGSLAPRFEEQGIKVFSLEQSGPFDFPSYPRMIRLIRELEPDLVVTHLLYADLIGRFIIQYFLPCRVIASLATTYNFPQYFWARVIERVSKYCASGYIANAEIVKKTYVERFGVPEQKITVLTTGMDTSLFRALSPDEALRNELGISVHDTVFICVANLHINKGHTYLLSAFEQVHRTHPHTKLLLVGDGLERASLENQSRSSEARDAIRFLGQRSDVPKLLGLSHVFVLPTFFEGMCNAIMEAMAAGLSVVTSDIPENRELITHEQTGLLCPVKDVTSLVLALTRLLDHPEERRRFGEAASESIQRRYELHASAQRWKHFFLSSSNV